MRAGKHPLHTEPSAGLSVHAVIALGFAALILLTALLLMLPVSSRSGTWTDPLTALFTAASAACVTGLAVADTAAHFSLFGRAVILLAIQAGGLGVMTVMAAASMLLGRRIGLRQRVILLEGVSSLQLGGVVRLVRRAAWITAVCELLGACLFAFRFVPALGLWRGAGHALFLSVSAFCNAGFDLSGSIAAPFSSLESYLADPLILLTASALIFLGGLGFFVYDDLLQCRFAWRRLRLHSRIVLLSAPVLVFAPALLFFLFERHGSLSGLSPAVQAALCLFSALTPRTAGFSAVPVAALSSASRLLTMLLMFIGGFPGSTAGGAKVTTLLLLLLLFASVLRREEDVHILGRRLPPDALRRACAIAAGYLVLAAVSSLLLCALEPGLPAGALAFEALSALCTAGLSVGVTRALGAPSRIVLILLMFAGRLGSLTLALLSSRRSRPAPVRYPADHLLIG